LEEPRVVEKVVAYVVRGDRLAVFVHLDDTNPVYESGLQVPAGTVEVGESPVEAVLREVLEETGLRDVRVRAHLGVADYDVRPAVDAIHRRHYFQLAVDGPVPEEWVHVETDGGVGAPRPFRFSWLPIEGGHSLVAGLGAMLAKVDLGQT
jgi:8-oxo-dGTP pyrophosphatase MutT (NUDIX family)